MRKFWQFLSGLILVNFITEIIYSAYMVFYAVGGSKYPLMKKAEETPVEVILKRRLYGIELWIALAGMTTYLGVTEVLPRKLEVLMERSVDKPG